MNRLLTIASTILPLAACAPAALPSAQAPAPATGLGAAITPEDVRPHLFVLAHDSMEGRHAGTPAHDRATDYIARTFQRAGLQPAGTDGTFFQTVPLVRSSVDRASLLRVGAQELRHGRDFVILGTRAPQRALAGGTAVYGGTLADEASWISEQAATGRVVVVRGTPESLSAVTRLTRAGDGAYRGAAALLIAGLELPDAEAPESFRGPAADTTSLPLIALASADAAEAMLGTPLSAARPGAAGRAVTGRAGWLHVPAPTRNVVALLPGSDPALRGQYVVVGAHNDHEGIGPEALDHDSVRAYNRVMRPQGANDPVGRPSAAQAQRIRALTDSLHRARGGVLRDSIFNGADDDASGTAALLAIAQAMATLPERPRRSVLFVSHTAEELGLVGSRYFTDYPTVPRDSIVAAFNMDMVGRGRPEDIAGGGPHYLQMIGSRRLATGLGDLVDAINASRAEPMRIDYSFDAPGHRLNRYCRSDHFMYARYGIPIVYISRGYHVDYHQVTDEPEYIDYDGLARVAGFVAQLAHGVASADQRPVVDQPVPPFGAPCRQ